MTSVSPMRRKKSDSREPNIEVGHNLKESEKRIQDLNNLSITHKNTNNNNNKTLQAVERRAQTTNEEDSEIGMRRKGYRSNFQQQEQIPSLEAKEILGKLIKDIFELQLLCCWHRQQRQSSQGLTIRLSS